MGCQELRGTCKCIRQGGRLCLWHCHRRGLIQAHPTQGCSSCEALLGSVWSSPLLAKPWHSSPIPTELSTRRGRRSREITDQQQEISHLPRYDHKPHYLLNPYAFIYPFQICSSLSKFSSCSFPSFTVVGLGASQPLQKRQRQQESPDALGSHSPQLMGEALIDWPQ